MINAGPFQRGETISFRVGVTTGAVGDVTGLPTAKLKAMKAGSITVPGDETAFAATFAVTTAAAEGTVPAGWTITLSAAQTLALLAGQYVTDVRCVVAGGIYISEPCAFRLNEAVTS